MLNATIQHPATDQLREKARNLGADLKEIGGLAPDAAREQYQQVKAKVKDCAHYTGEQFVKVKGGVENFVRERPLQSVLIAVSAGVLAGLLIGRRR